MVAAWRPGTIGSNPKRKIVEHKKARKKSTPSVGADLLPVFHWGDAEFDIRSETRDSNSGQV